MSTYGRGIAPLLMGRTQVLGLVLAAASAIPIANAQNLIYDLSSTEIIRDRSIVPLSPDDAFGDSIDLESGSLGISVPIVSLPGNNDLPVSYHLRLEQYMGALGVPKFRWITDDRPYLSATFSRDYRWVTGTVGNPSKKRCSQVDGIEPPNDVPSHSGKEGYWEASEYFNGYWLNIPGGQSELLGVTPQADVVKPTSGGPYKWVTNSLWYFSCVTQPDGEERFIGHSPDGKKYYFGGVESLPVYDLKKYNIYGQTILSRVEGRMYVYRVEDRFGNYSSYTSSNDGRSLTKNTVTNADRSFVTTISDGTRTWTIEGNAQSLDRVVRYPDGSAYIISIASSLTQGVGGTASCSNSQSRLFSGAADIVVKSRSGARATYRLEPRQRGFSHIPFHCYSTDAGGELFVQTPNIVTDLSLVRKVVSGAGIPSVTVSYDYGPLNNCYASYSSVAPCTANDPISRFITESRSDGIKRVYEFGNKYNENQGKLLSVSIFNPGSTSKVKITTNAWIVFAGAANFFPAGGFDTSYSLEPLRRARVSRSVIGQDGAQFVYSVGAFDSLIRPTSVTKSSQGHSKTEVTAYHDNLSKWILGQPAKLTVNGIVASETEYSATNALPVSRRSYGLLQETYTYTTTTGSQDGTLRTVTDGNGNITTLTNWNRGIPQSIAYADGTTQSAIVNDAGWITRVTDENGFATNYAYDPMGRLSRITYPTGDNPAWNATTFVFEQRASSAYGLPAGHWRQVVSTGNGIKRTYFDALWRPVLVQEYDAGNVAATNRYTRHAYDHEGRTTFTSYPVSSVSSLSTVTQGTHTSYDALGRTTTVRHNSELGDLVTAYSYIGNADSYYTRITDPKGNQTRIQYQAFDQPSDAYPTVLTYPGGRTDIVRDVFGKPVSITRSGGGVSATRNYVYNANHLPCKVVDPETRATILAYDGAGNLAWSKTGSGYRSIYSCNVDLIPAADRTVRTYDKRNRLTSVSYPDNLGNATYSYTPDGLLAQVLADNGGGRLVYNNYVYNKRRLLTGESMNWGSIGYGIGYGYNANGHLASHAYPGAVTVAYAPNALGQPTQAGTWATNVSYHPNGAIRQFTYGNGVVHTMTPNSRGLPERIREAYSSATRPVVPIDESYDYDGNGNVVAISDGRVGQRGNRDMTYDGLDRLTRVDSPMFGTALYTYDALDNLRRVQVGPTALRPARDHTYEYDTRNRLVSIVETTGGAAVTSLGYDLQGNIASRTGASYSFDFGNRLRGANHGGTDSSYVYDGHGRRVRDYVGGSNYSQYNRDGVLMFTRSRRGDNTFRQYIHLGGRLVAIRTDDRDTGAVVNQFQHTDALGSVVARSSQGRTSVLYSEYEPYGALSNRADYNGPGYTGHVQDAATGLTYMQQRYYDPLIGRFLSVDPVAVDSGIGANFNRYWYAANNPYRFIDPDGREERMPHLELGYRDRFFDGQYADADFAVTDQDSAMISAVNREVGVWAVKNTPGVGLLYGLVTGDEEAFAEAGTLTAGVMLQRAGESLHQEKLNEFNERSRSWKPTGRAARRDARIMLAERKTLSNIGRGIIRSAGPAFIVLGLSSSTATMIENVERANQRIYEEP